MQMHGGLYFLTLFSGSFRARSKKSGRKYAKVYLINRIVEKIGDIYGDQ